MVLTLVLSLFLLGAATGLRTMTPIMVVCWFAYLGKLPVQGTWGFWTANVISVVVFSLMALGEYVGDKLPQTPNRIAPPLLGARFCFGAFAGAIVMMALKGSVAEGGLVGGMGAVFGAFCGYWIRRELVRKIVGRDWPVAVAEDVFAVGCAVLAIHVITK